MADTFVKIASVTVGSGGASSIDFTSIPSTYTDLCIKLSGRINSTNVGWYDANITFNGSGSSYTGRYLYGNGSSTYSGTETSITVRTSSNVVTANTFGNAEIYIPNYAGSNYKSVSIDQVAENNATLGLDMITTSLWSNTAAINQVTLTPISSTTWLQYSTAVLYGISNS